MAIASTSPVPLSPEAAAQLGRLYAQATETIRRTAERATATAARQRVLLLEVEAILQQLDADAAALLAREIPLAYRQGVRQSAKGLKQIGFTEAALSFDGKFHADALQLLMLDAQDALLQATDGIRKQFRLTLRRTQLARAADKKITENIARGLISGQTRREVSREILATTLRDFADKPLTINGRNYDAGKYAELVARTKTREAVTKGTVNRLIETGNDLVMVTAHGSTDGCGFYEGRVFSISGTSEKYPPLASLPGGGPPFHDNCRHNLAPFVEVLASGAEKRRARKIDKRAIGKSYGDVEKLARRVGV